MVYFSIELLRAYLHDELTQDATRELELVLARDPILRQTVASLRIEATGIQTLGDDDEEEELGWEADLRAQVLEAAASASADGDALVIASTEERTDDISGLIDIRSMTQTIATGESADASELDLAGVRPSLAPLMTLRQPRVFLWLAIALATSVTVLIVLGTILINWLHAPKDAEIAILDAKIEMLNARLSSQEAEEGTKMSMETALILYEIESLRALREARQVTSVQEEKPASVPMDARQVDPKRASKVAPIKHKQSPDAAGAPKPDSDAQSEPLQTPSSNDLDNLIGQAPPNKESSLSDSASTSGDLNELPETLTKNQVRSGLEKVAKAVEECAKGQTGVMKVSLVIKGANGRVESAKATGTFQGTASGACAERVVKMARFSSFKKSSLTVTYPFNIVGLSTNPYDEQGTDPLKYSQID